jgi:hypothetical protein
MLPRRLIYQAFLRLVIFPGPAIVAGHTGRLGGEPVELIAHKILLKLGQLADSRLQHEQRVLQLVRLALLRNLSTAVF